MSDLENRDPPPEPRTLDLEARRLFVSAALTAQAARLLEGRIAGDTEAGGLLDLALRLGAGAEHLERAYRLRFEPSFPGVTAGPETVRGGSRLLLACAVFDRDRRPLGVAFTALIPGRPPQVSVAPAGTSIPGEWSLPEGAP
jgi:hypothetical protein